MTAGYEGREPGRLDGLRSWLAGVRRWLDDNAVQLVLFGIAFGGSFNHWVHLADRNGQTGIESYIAAFCVDLGVYRMTKERARDIRIGRKPSWGFCTLPTLFLVGLIVLTLAGNVYSAKHTRWGMIVALIPSAVLLMAIALGERRAAHDARQAKASKARADRQADADRRQADRQRRLEELAGPGGPDVTPASANASGVTVMRAYWDSEVAAGRIPTGADLVREAKLSPTSSLGRQMAAKWRPELGELDGAAR
jgi:hypothetical protein